MFSSFITATLLLALAQSDSGSAAPAGPVFDLALSGYNLVVADSLVEPGALLAVIDYSLPSTEPRLFVIDPSDGTVLRSSLVAHGRESGQNMAERFSNEPGSARHGRLGRSWGCPALPLESTKAIIDLIKDGTCLFVYGTDPAYLENSRFLGPGRSTGPPPTPKRKG
jgi:hypothetical protein